MTTQLPLKFAARWIILDDTGRILIVKHRPSNPWTLPGGHVEKDETFQDALIREAREELNMDIRLMGGAMSREAHVTILPNPVHTHVIEYTNEKGPEKKYEEIFIAQIVSGSLQKQDEEIHAIAWKTPAEIEALSKEEIYPGIRALILDVCRKGAMAR